METFKVKDTNCKSGNMITEINLQMELNMYIR